MNSTLVIYNPVAGRGRVQAQWPQVEQALREAGLDFDAVPTSAPGKAFWLAREAPKKYKMVVSVGGDGTIHESEAKSGSSYELCSILQPVATTCREP